MKSHTPSSRNATTFDPTEVLATAEALMRDASAPGTAAFWADHGTSLLANVLNSAAAAGGTLSDVRCALHGFAAGQPTSIHGAAFAGLPEATRQSVVATANVALWKATNGAA